MPWTPEEFKRKHNKKLTDQQAEVAAMVANEVLEKTGDEGRAIREGNAAADRIKPWNR
jgi:uncharacterized protein YdaT